MKAIRHLCLALCLALATGACHRGKSTPPELQAAAPITQPGQMPQTAATRPASAPTAPMPSFSDGIGDGVVTLRWQTGRENQVTGFHVMRGESQQGAFIIANPQLIRASGTSEGPHAYEYTDQNLQPGKTYYYYLEQVFVSGEQQRLSETLAITAQLPSRNSLEKPLP